jgi:hypothetical protein
MADSTPDATVADTPTDAPAEDTDKVDAPDTEAPADETTKADEDTKKDDSPKESPEERGFAERLAAIEAELAAEREARAKAEADLADYTTKTEKAAAIREAGLPEQFADFLSGDKDSWQGKIDALVALRGQSQTAAPTVPRDPAVDSDPSPENPEAAFARALLLGDN